MDKKIKDFLDSGQLESYIIGGLSPDEMPQVEKMIADHPAIQEEYMRLQESLQSLAFQGAMQPPSAVKESILQSVKNTPNSSQTSTSKWLWIGATGILAIATLYAGFWGNKTNKAKQQLEQDYATLLENCSKNEQMIASFFETNTNKKAIVGNGLMPSFQASFFYDKNKQSMHYATSGIDLPNDKCLQLWGDIDGEMIPITVLQTLPDGTYTTVAFDRKMESFNVTIEDKIENGFQDHPNVEQLIGSVSI